MENAYFLQRYVKDELNKKAYYILYKSKNKLKYTKSDVDYLK